MDLNQICISLLFLTVIVSGCIGGGDSQSSVINIHGMDIAPAEIREGAETRVKIEFSNQGNQPAEVFLGKKGNNILTDYCRDRFQIVEEEYNVVTSGSELSSGDGENPESIKLKEGDEAVIEWTLNHVGDTPTHGYRCKFRMGVPFEYSVQALQEIEIKRSRNAEPAPSHDSQSTSGPLFFQINSDGSTAEEGEPVFVAGDDSITLFTRFQNIGQSEENRRTEIKIHGETLKIEADDPLQLNESFKSEEPGEEDTGWNPDTQKITQGEGNYVWEGKDYSEPKCNLRDVRDLRITEGKSRIIRCSLGEVSESSIDKPSVVAVVRGKVDYTFRKYLGAREVKVNPSGL